MLPLPAGHEAIRGRHPFTLRFPLSREYVISSSDLSFIYIYSFPTVNPHTLVNSSLYLCLLLSFLLQSKHKEDALATCPILLDEPKCEVCLLPFFIIFLLFSTYFLCHMPLVVSSPFQHHHKLCTPLFLILPSSLFFFCLFVF